MKCFHHPEADAVGYCRTCGKALCEDCRREVRGVFYCEDCLATTLAVQPAAGAPSPGVALALGFIPGVGAIYNGEYAKALIHLIIFGGLISLADSRALAPFESLFIMLAVGFYFYMPFEAYQTAKRRGLGLAPTTTGWGALGFANGGQATVLGPLILIVLGVLFLLHTLDLVPWTWRLARFWPIILIVIGVLLLRRRVGGEPKV